jgi:two-component system C4-dicarboxylate transport sensor histidine kinase DctB
VLEAISDARVSASRIATATSYLPLLASSAALSRHTLPMTSLVEGALADAERQLGRSISAERSFEHDLMVTADSGRLSHALRLAIVNGALASGERKLVLHLLAHHSRVHFGIEDQGPGIGQDMAGSIGAPFDARRPQGIGDALGLFVASRLVAELDGELVLLPKPSGTRVEIRLPRA